MKDWKKSRFYNWLYAHTHSYFWTRCPLCGKGFGGHEKSTQQGLPVGDWSFATVCPDPKCQERAKDESIAWVRAQPPILFDTPGIVQIQNEQPLA